MYFFIILNEVNWKEIYSCFFFPLFHEHSLSLEIQMLSTFLKLVLKKELHVYQDNAHDVDIFPYEGKRLVYFW